MVERTLDKRYPVAATILKLAAKAYDDTRAMRESVRADQNLSPMGQHAEIMKRLEKAAAALQKHRQAIDRARADIEKRRAGLRPKFEKVDPAILAAVATRIATMKTGEQAALLLPEGKDTDPVVAQAVLELPPILSGVNDQLRGVLETRLIEKTHGPALAALDDEREAWEHADAALRTAIDAMQTAGEFPSPHAFSLWFQKVAPSAAVATPDQRREDEAVTVETILSQAQGLSHDAYTKLYKGVGELSSKALDRELAGLRSGLG
jgi:hypothetical protein